MICLMYVILIRWGSSELWRKAWRENFNAMSSTNFLWPEDWTGSVKSSSAGSVGRKWTQVLEATEQKYQKYYTEVTVAIKQKYTT